MRRSSLVGLKDFSERKQDLKTKQKKKNEKNDSVMRNCSVKMKKAAGGKQNSLRLPFMLFKYILIALKFRFTFSH